MSGKFHAEGLSEVGDDSGDVGGAKNDAAIFCGESVLESGSKAGEGEGDAERGLFEEGGDEKDATDGD